MKVNRELRLKKLEGISEGVLVRRRTTVDQPGNSLETNAGVDDLDVEFLS